MAEFFAPYEGDAPYLFVSYSHRDTQTVLPIIRSLRDRLVRVWYDEGIPAGSDWPKSIEQHLRGCAAVLLFVSPPAMDSPNCTSELVTATDLGKPIIAIPVDGCKPTGLWKERLEGATWARSDADAIAATDVLDERFTGTEADYARNLRRRAHRSPWVVAQYAAAALLVAALGLFAALVTGRLNPFPQRGATVVETVVAQPVVSVDLSAYGNVFVDAIVFPDTQQERAVRAALGAASGSIGRERLLELTDLHFVGNMTPTSVDGLSFASDGTCTLNGAPVITGQVSDLSLIADMPYLEHLTLACQPLDALGGLSGHQALSQLSLAGSSVDDLSALSNLPALTELRLEHTGVRDLTPLYSLPALRRVTVSADMTPLTLPPNTRFDLVLVP